MPPKPAHILSFLCCCLRGLLIVPRVKGVADNETSNRANYRGSHTFKGLTAMVPRLWLLTLLRSLKTPKVRFRSSSLLRSSAEMLSDPTVFSLVWSVLETTADYLSAGKGNLRVILNILNV